MAIQYRHYQDELDTKTHCAWNTGVKNVLGVSPTGSGKTVVFSGVLKKHTGASCAMAHRNSLVTQISRALNRNEVPHRLIAQPAVIREAVRIHEEETGKSHYHPQAPCGVASVKTLLSRQDKLKGWLNQVTKKVTDEAHHLLKVNEWGRAWDLMGNAQGMGVTATPCRADGQGLGRTSDGVFDQMIETYSQRWMILEGWLVDAKIVSVPTDIDFSKIKPGSTGDYTRPKLKQVEEGSHIVGDVVQEYLKHASGKLGVTFASNIETAEKIVAEFNTHNVPAVLVHADTPDAERFAIERRFKNRELLQLVNVDLFGEGYDLPQLEVISMARKTDSFSLFVQQAGRVLRTSYAEFMLLDTREQRLAAIAASHKPFAMIIDHVSNVKRHARARYCDYTGELYIDLCHAEWGLDPRDRRSQRDPDLIPSLTCPSCAGEYAGTLRKCPFCAEEADIEKRTNPVEVQGDLELLTPEALMEMIGTVNEATKPSDQVYQEMIGKGVQPMHAHGHADRQFENLKTYKDLGDAIDWFGGHSRSLGREDFQTYRMFYYRFGVDILSARGVEIKKAKKLNEDIRKYLLDQSVKLT
jgi:superfamily II DNA or RNA helicase